MRGKEFKVDSLRQRRLETETTYSPTEIFVDEIYYGWKVIFQIIEHRLEGELIGKNHNDEIVGKFVQVVGHIQLLIFRNHTFISQESI